jgi:hypothetical protein
MSTTFSRDLYRNIDGDGSFRWAANSIFNQSTCLKIILLL